MSAEIHPGIDFSDEQQCLRLIDNLPLTKLSQVHESLAVLVGGMQATPPAARAYLDVLELARPSLAFVQDEMAGRYAQTALPPGSPEEETLRRVVTLWQAMARGYAQVAQLGADDPQVQSRLALICQRCVQYSGKAIIEYFRARRELPRGVWSDVHGYYATAEEWNIARVEVADPLNESQRKQSCAQAYAEVLLLDIGNPYGRTPREFGWLVRWCQRFAPFADVLEVDPASSDRTYAVDLLKDRGLLPVEILERSEHLRQLATTRLSAEMHRVLGELKRRTAAGQLGLGEDCSEPACSRLLVSLYRPWCLAARPRRFQRRTASGTAQLSYGFEAIHFYVGGEEFVQPQHVRVYSRQEVDAIWTFRHQIDPTHHLYVRAAQIGYTMENWAVADESAGGFRLLRFGTGVRVEHGQLLGLRPPDGERFLLCQVSWLQYLASGALAVGVYVLPGAPQTVAARQKGLGFSPSEKYSPAFLLPAMPALNQEPTVVLPKGWFQRGRVVEIHTDRRFQVKLIDVVNPGADFDRVRYAQLKSAV